MRKELYEENWEIQLLRRELEQAEAWLTAKESFLSDPSYGVSKDSTTLLKWTYRLFGACVISGLKLIIIKQ